VRGLSRLFGASGLGVEQQLLKIACVDWRLQSIYVHRNDTVGQVIPETVLKRHVSLVEVCMRRSLV
jgi:hypothetical protein